MRSPFASRLATGLFAGVLLLAFCLASSAALAESGQRHTTILVASPHLWDPNFRQTVVFLFQWDEDGAFGVIVNRPTEIAVADAFPETRQLGKRHDVVWIGGPVLPNGLLSLLRTGDLEGEKVIDLLPDVKAVDPDDAIAEIRRLELGEEKVRFFAGHAGWAAGQLEAEIARGDWYQLPPRAEWIFSEEPEDLWKELLELASLPAT